MSRCQEKIRQEKFVEKQLTPSGHPANGQKNVALRNLAMENPWEQETALKNAFLSH